MQKVNNFEVIDHGVMVSDYFQGCGTAYTEFSHVVTGIGDNISEAINDCLEQIAQCDFDTDGLEERIVAEYGDIPNSSAYQEAIDDNFPEPDELDFDTEEEYQDAYEKWEEDCENFECEVYHYVSIRWN